MNRLKPLPFSKDFFEFEISKSISHIFIKIKSSLSFFKDYDSNCLNYRRGNKLWDQNCFELFLENSKDFKTFEPERDQEKHYQERHYIEFHLAPNSLWNCFELRKYRGELFETNKVELEAINLKRNDGKEIEIILKYFDFSPAFYNIGVINYLPKPIYYSLAHKEDNPDFHDLELYRRF